MNMQDNEQALARDFRRRLWTFSQPTGSLEGAIKSIVAVSPVSTLAFFLSSPENAMRLFLAAAFFGLGWGGTKEERPRNQLTFWERSISFMPPLNRKEGFVKGFSAAFLFSACTMLYSKFKFTPEYLPIAFLTCVGIAAFATGGLAWGFQNEMRNARRR
jgi:hypothetical protein